MRKRGGALGIFVVLVLVAMAIVGLSATTAVAAEQNPECLSCHKSMQSYQWTVGPVDRDTACKPCHTQGLLGTHPLHHGGDCGAYCHPGWGAELDSARPGYSGPAGSFAAASSKDVTAGVIHIIHSTPRWPADVDTPNSRCASCHAIADCDTCHQSPNAPANGHAVHGSTGSAEATARAPWTGQVGHGVTGEDQTILTAGIMSNQCMGPDCHNIAGTSASAPAMHESEATTRTGSLVTPWRTRVGSNFSGGMTQYSTDPNGVMQFVFTGDAFELIGDNDPYRGQSQVWVDGALATTIDQYAQTSSYQQVLYRSPKLGAGTHTVEVRATGLKHASSRAAYVFVDGFRVYAASLASTAPKCVTCHPTREAAHGTSFSHDASQQAGTYAGFTCAQCHETLMINEHKRDSAVSKNPSCNACHTTYAPYGFTPLYNGTCSWNAYGPGCHQSANGQAAHTATTTAHTASDAATQDCRTCHGSNLAVIHDDTNASRSQHASLVGTGTPGSYNYTTNCLTCHGTTKYPTTKDCTSAGCHAVVRSMATHPAPSHNATNTNPGVSVLATVAGVAYTCDDCHNLELTNEHGKSSSVTTQSAAIGCTTCHNAPYFSTVASGWITPPNNTCIKCHPVAGGYAGKPHDGPTVAHNFNPYATNTTSCGSGGGTFCHQTGMVDFVHDNSVTGNTQTQYCDACHTNNTSVPAIRDCQTCHTAAPHNMTKHVAPSSSACVECHEQGGDVTLIHASCVQCHNNPSWPGITAGKTTQCTGCHTTGGPGGVYLPTDPNHYTGTESTHTASAQVGTVGGFACTQCHQTEMKPEHITKTSSAFPTVPGTHSDKCVACHELRVDALGAWNKTCDSCHAAKHGSMASKHDASATALSGAITTVTPYFNNIESGTLTTWTVTGNVFATPTAPIAGTYSMAMGNAGTAPDYATSASFSTSGMTSLTVSFKYQSIALDAAEYMRVQYSTNGSTYNDVWIFNPSGTATTTASTVTTSIPVASATTTIRLRVDAANATGEWGRFDDIQVSGRQQAASPGSAMSTCGGGGCHTVNDVSAIHNNSIATNGLTPDCATCHASSTVLPTLLDCTASGCHNGMTAHNHTLNVATSTYNNTTVSGCANSGNGCHGTDSGGNYAGYHPASGCTGGACHAAANHNDAAFNDPNSCQNCHGGGAVNYAGAPLVSKLTTSTGANGGHYNETTHTAAAASLTGTVTAGGTASATCQSCHNNVSASGIDGLYAQHQNLAAPYNNTTCADCHGFNAGVTAEIAASWTNNLCSDCHNATDMPSNPQHGSSAPTVTATSAYSCGTSGANCHGTGNNLHALHRNAATGCGLTGCHDYAAQGVRPTATSCGLSGSCHTSYTNTHNTITGDESTHTAGATQQTDSTYQSTTCGACHSMQLTVEHTATTSVKSLDATNTCKNCHNNPASTTAITSTWTGNKNSTSACSQCHTGSLARHTDASATAHSPANTGCGSTGPGCHPTNNIASVGVPTTQTAIHNNCLNCHDRASANGSWSSALVGTGQTIRYSTATKSCGQSTGCHTASLYSTSTANHRVGRGDQITGDDTTHTANATYMASTVTSGTATNVCTDCHIGTLKSEHATTSIGAIGCTTGGTGNVGCHNMVSGSIAPTSAAVVKGNWNSGADTCASCHALQHNAIGSSHTATGTAGCASSVAGCHPTSDLVTLHKNRVGGGGCKLAGCHDAANKSLRPNKKSCGTGGTCHSTYTTTTHNGTITGNDTTHTATTMNADATGGSYTTGGGNTCDACHSAGLNSAHTTVTARLESNNTSWGASPFCQDCHGTGTGGSPTGPDDAITVIKTDSWSAKTCDQCHVTRGNGKHASYNTSHTAALGTGGVADGCAGASCHGTTDVRAIHNVNHVTYNEGCTVRSSGSNSTSDSALACHDINKSMRNPVTGALSTPMSCGQGSGGCHTNHNNTNHGGSHTLDVTTSNYSNATVAGCTNSGSGCHGTDAAANYAAVQYHPVAGAQCASGNCHNASATNHNNTAFNDPNTCQNCHGGGAVDYVNAPLVSTLTTTTGANQGHYNETTHTAIGMATVVSGTTTGTVSASCNDCHNANSAAGIKQLYAQHQGLQTAGNTTCSDCHNYNINVAAEITGSWTTDQCSDCHNVTDMPTAVQHATTGGVPSVTATQSATDPNYPCVRSGCHVDANVHRLHAVDNYGAANGCGMTGCHDYTKQGWKPAKATCGQGGTSGCHNVGDPHGALHNAPASTACVDCHETDNVQTLHAAKGDGCTVCHGGGGYTDLTIPGRTTQCTNCHDGVVVASGHTYTGQTATSQHYTTNLTTHTAAAASMTSTFTTSQASVPGWGNYTAANQCNECHTNTLMTEHTTGTASFSTVPGTYANACVACHEGKVDSLGGAWNDNCTAQCHTTIHTNWSTKHSATASTTLVTSCGTPSTDCHDLADVADIHTYDENGDGDRADTGEAHCEACHVNATTRATTWNCTASSCHGGTGTWYNPADRTSHIAVHDTSTTASVADGNTYSRTTRALDPQCQVCHWRNMQSDHATLTADSHDATPHNNANTAYGTFSGSGDTNKCAPCHYKASASASPSVDATTVRQSIAQDKMNCATCHTNTTEPTATPTYYKMHIDHTTSGATTGSTEWNKDASGHRAFSWMRGVITTAGASGQAMAWPTLNVFRTGVTLDGAALSTTSMVHCDDCHGNFVAAGPHGGSVEVTMATGYKYDWNSASLTNTGDGFNNATVICAKCHDLYNAATGSSGFSNNVHGRSNHYAQCTRCHISIPHAWKRPRLLSKSTDPAPYRVNSNLNGIQLSNYSTISNGANTSWTDLNCGVTGCDNKTNPATMWP